MDAAGGCGRGRRGAGLLERLAEGPVICAEGYLFEFERRGYLQAGAYVPEVVLEHPELVAQLHREFVHAGSDVVEAFTYYAHREKLRLIGKEHLLEEMNRQALAIAKEVAARERRALRRQHLQHERLRRGRRRRSGPCGRCSRSRSAGRSRPGSISSSARPSPGARRRSSRSTSIKQAGKPAVITLAIHQQPVTREGWSPEEACAPVGGGGGGRRRAELHPRTADDAAAC